MRGIFTGMAITLKHFFGRKVTRLYPYEKRELPPRTRGLIHYLTDDKGQYKCEACLLCEKICPPQAITVTYRAAQTHRARPLTLAKATWGHFRRSRQSLLSRSGRVEQAIDQRQPKPGERAVDWTKVSALLSDNSGAGLFAALREIQDTLGYLPRHALERVASEGNVDLSTLYGLATGAIGFRGSADVDSGIVVCFCPACQSAGAARLAPALAGELPAGETGPSASHRSRCLGSAGQSPVIVVAGQVWGNVTPDRARQLVREHTAVGGAR